MRQFRFFHKDNMDIGRAEVGQAGDQICVTLTTHRKDQASKWEMG